jgi:hypothetical protein
MPIGWHRSCSCPPPMRRFIALTSCLALQALTTAALAHGGGSSSNDPPGLVCHEVKGKFESLPAPTCNSLVGLCTAGELSGSLRGGYGFVMSQMVEPMDATIPSVTFFTGTSTITRRHGTLIGTDAGSLDLNAGAFGAFATLITITGGTGSYTRAAGYLQVRGKLDFTTGGAKGDYKGKICSRQH